VELADVALTPVAGGVRLRLRVVPGARRDAVLGPHGDALRVAVRAVPEKGRANQAVQSLLAAALDVPTQQVVLLAGMGGRDKHVEVRGLAVEDVRARLAAAAATPARSGGR
jgi:uncharacterized protein YggU (UPF0235/DUF167 family)